MLILPSISCCIPCHVAFLEYALPLSEPLFTGDETVVIEQFRAVQPIELLSNPGFVRIFVFSALAQLNTIRIAIIEVRNSTYPMPVIFLFNTLALT